MPPDLGADTSTASKEPASPPALTVDGDWAVQLTQKVEQAVAIIRDKMVTPVAIAVRYVIFGITAAVVTILVTVLLAVLIIRVLDNEVPGLHGNVWASYFIVAGIFWIAGLLLSRMRHPRS